MHKRWTRYSSELIRVNFNNPWTKAKAEYQKMEYPAPIFRWSFEEGEALGEKRGISIGEKRGMDKGKVTAKGEVLSRQLLKKFDTLPKNVKGRVESASLEQLDLWLDRVVDAQTLDQVFA